MKNLHVNDRELNLYMVLNAYFGKNPKIYDVAPTWMSPVLSLKSASGLFYVKKS